MAITDLILPSGVTPEFFRNRINAAKKGFWFDVTGGAMPVSGTVINLTELVPVKYNTRSNQVIAYGDASPRSKAVTLSLYDYAQQIRRDVANQDGGGAIVRDMDQAARKANLYGNNLLVASLNANTDTAMDGVVMISAAHTGSQSNTRSTGYTNATLTMAQADTAVVATIDALRALKDDATSSTDLINADAVGFMVLTSNSTRFSLYNQALADGTGASKLPGYIKGGMSIQPVLWPGLANLKDYVIRLDGEQAYVSGLYGDKVWAGEVADQDVYRWYHTFNQAVVPFRWQSIFEFTYA